MFRWLSLLVTVLVKAFPISGCIGVSLACRIFIANLAIGLMIVFRSGPSWQRALKEGSYL